MINKLFSTCTTVSLLLLADICFAQVPSTGRCPTQLTTVQDFDVEQYLGLWYEVEKYPLALEAGGKCTTTTFDIMDERTIRMTNNQINRFTKNGSGFVARIMVSPTGQLVLSLPIQPFSTMTIEAPYWILDTDYNNYAVVYACRDIAGFMSAEVVWILTRSPRPNPAVIQRAYNVLDQNRLSKTFLTHTDHSNCNHTHITVY